MAAHRGHGSELCTSAGQAPDQTGKYPRLRLSRLGCHISCELPHIGVHDGQFQRDAGAAMSLDKAPVVVFGGGRPNTADETNMHRSTSRDEPAALGLEHLHQENTLLRSVSLGPLLQGAWRAAALHNLGKRASRIPTRIEIIVVEPALDIRADFGPFV